MKTMVVRNLFSDSSRMPSRHKLTLGSCGNSLHIVGEPRKSLSPLFLIYTCGKSFRYFSQQRLDLRGSPKVKKDIIQIALCVVNTWTELEPALLSEDVMFTESSVPIPWPSSNLFCLKATNPLTLIFPSRIGHNFSVWI